MRRCSTIQRALMLGRSEEVQFTDKGREEHWWPAECNNLEVLLSVEMFLHVHLSSFFGGAWLHSHSAWALEESVGQKKMHPHKCFMHVDLHKLLCSSPSNTSDLEHPPATSLTFSFTPSHFLSQLSPSSRPLCLCHSEHLRDSCRHKRKFYLSDS